MPREAGVVKIQGRAIVLAMDYGELNMQRKLEAEVRSADEKNRHQERERHVSIEFECSEGECGRRMRRRC